MSHLRVIGKILGITAIALAPVWASAADIWVDSELDGTPAGVCTLRAAIQAANTDASVEGCSGGDGHDFIRFSSGIDSIFLTEGQLPISSSMTINDLGASVVTVDAQSNSRVFEVSTNVHAEFFSMTITGGSADLGAGLLVQEEAFVQLVDANVTANIAQDAGGGIAVISGSLDIRDSNIQGNMAEIGGGFHIREGQSWFQDSVVQNNSATLGGGIAIEWENADHVWFNPLETLSTTITGNHAETGGGLYLALTNNAAGFEFQDLLIEENTATRHGGGIAITRDYARVTNSTIQNNQVIATPGDDEAGGGGIAIVGSGNLELESSSISNNAAPRGGGIYIQPFDFEFIGLLVGFSEISDNLATHEGGGIGLADGWVDVWSSEIENNQSTVGGGIHMVAGSLNLWDAQVQYNEAERGGGVALEKPEANQGQVLEFFVDSSPIGHNRAGIGGGVFLELKNLNAPTPVFHNWHISNNEATSRGGGIAISNSSIQLTDSLIENNLVIPDNTDGYGGGVALTGGSHVFMSNCTVTGNNAPTGGGIYLDQTGMAPIWLGLDFCSVTNNIAQRGGGAAQDGGDFTAFETEIEFNQAEIGGGLYVTSEYLQLTNVSLQNNSADMGGGVAGVFEDLPLPTWDDNTFLATPIQNNHAEIGGGIYLDITPVSGDGIQLQQLEILDNTATQLGGGIFVNGGADLRGILIQGNEVTGGRGNAQAGGGGIGLTEAGFINLFQTTVTGNSAPNGGGVYIDAPAPLEGGVFMLSSQITQNSAQSGGGVALAEGVFFASESQIRSNQAMVGGGIHTSGGDLHLVDVLLRQNSAEHGGGVAGIFEKSPLPVWDHNTFSSTPIQNNSAAIGGGIYLDITDPASGQMELRELEIVDNQASQLGGGFAIAGGDAKLEQSLIEGNVVTDMRGDARAGGGGIAALTPGQLFLNEVVVRNNSAPSGGGVYIDIEDSSLGLVLIDSSEITHNSAQSGGGLTLVDGSFGIFNSEIEFNQATIGGGLQILGWDFTVGQSTSLRYNVAEKGGGVAIGPRETPLPSWNPFAFHSTPIEDNEANTGGGIYVELMPGGFKSLHLDGLQVSGNEAATTGGGIAVARGSLELTNSAITANSAVEGGGLHVLAPHPIPYSRVQDSEVTFNSASRGGGIALHGEGMEVIRSTVFHNTATLDEQDPQSGLGGGIWGDESEMILDDTTLSQNSAEVGGGLYLRLGGTSINNSRISENSGGGIDAESLHQMSMHHTQINDNHDGPVGGVRCVNCSQFDLAHSSVIGNSGLLVGGVDTLSDETTDGRGSGPVFTMFSSTVSGNNGSAVGGIRAEDADFRFGTVAFNTRTGNGALNPGDEASLEAGGIAVVHPPTLRNTIVAANQAADAPADLSVFSPGGQPGPALMDFSLVQDDSGFIPDGAGNLFGLAPGLAPLDGNGAAITLTHALQPDSPAIHNGDPDFSPPPEFDQRGSGFPRLRGGRLDIGAFESALAPAAMVSDDSLDFGNVRVAHSADPLTFQVSNQGNGALLVQDVTLADSDNGAFGLLDEQCSALVLAPGESCEVSVGFVPDASRPFEGGIAVTTNADSVPVPVTLHGQGVAAEILVDPASIHFGSVIAGQPGSVRELTVSNIGEHKLTVDSITPPSPPFELVDTPGCQTPPLTLLPEESCVFVFRFDPSEIGHFEQTLTLESDAEAGTSSVVLTGSGIGAALFEDRFEVGGGTP